MKLDIKKLLDFFDGNLDFHKGDANAVIAVLGEDLNSAVFKHYKKSKVKILDNSVLPVSNRGKRLDRWILSGNKLYQCEIKNWAANAIGGRKLSANATNKVIKNVVDYYWNKELNGNLSKNSKNPHPNLVTKVLGEMRLPEEYKDILNVEPLVIYWMPISNSGLNPLSVISVKSLQLPMESKFKNLYIFSVSLYLRQLYKNGKGQRFIDLDMVHLGRRLKILSGLIKK